MSRRQKRRDKTMYHSYHSHARWIALLFALSAATVYAAEDHEHHQAHQGHGQHQEAGDHAQHDHAKAAPPPAGDMKPRIPDRVLTDQFGKSHRFYSDLLKGKLVLMNSIFTTCPATCPIQTAVFAKVQQMLGERVGEDVQMISVTLEPETDTPERLKEFAERYKVGPGWLFLTGPTQDVTDVLKAMDLYSAVPAEHTPIAAVGHEPSGVWMKVLNLKAPAEIVGSLSKVQSLGEQKASLQ
jgi:cytochrome oxidase Cu insertion factor (SCO1/SenC/PrrC family)